MELDLTAIPTSDPAAVYRYRDGMYGADLLTAAIVHLDFFSWLEGKEATLAEVCQAFEVHARPADVMLTLFAAMGFIERKHERVCNTRTASEHLVKGSQWYLGPYYASLKDRPVCADFLRVLRTDRAANWGSFKQEKDWAKAMEEEDFAERFTAAMDCRGVFLAQALARNVDLSRSRKLLDVAGGSGIYACSLAAHYPNLRGVVFEKAPVDLVAKRLIEKRGLTGRVQVAAGDMFKEELPRGFDAHLVSNVLHDWNETTVEELLRKSFSALAPGGLLVIHDAHINAGKNGPLPVASYSAMLMHSTEGKCYSLSELYPMLERAGFRNPRHVETVVDRSAVLADRPG